MDLPLEIGTIAWKTSSLTCGLEDFCRYFQHCIEKALAASRRLLKTYYINVRTGGDWWWWRQDTGRWDCAALLAGTIPTPAAGAALLAGTLILSSPAKVTSTGPPPPAPSWEIQYSNIPNKQTNIICVCDKSVVKDVSFGTSSTPASHQQQASSLYWS